MKETGNKMVSNSNNKTTNSSDMVSDVLVTSIKKIATSRKSPWVGTLSELGSVLETKVASPEVLPASPSALRVSLNKVVNRLRSAGVTIRFSRSTSHDRTRLVKFWS
jgi:hypothetical protein